MDRRIFLKSTIVCCAVIQQEYSIAAATNGVSNSCLENHCHEHSSANANYDITYVAAAKGSTGLFSVKHFNLQGEILQSFDLPKRGHSFAINEQGYLLTICRRPGSYFLIVDPSLPNSESRLINAPKNRRYYGHATFNTDGNLAYLTENDLDSGQGVIGVYDVKKQFKRVGEFPSYGIGPHDILFDKQRGCLVVANGGIKTHPNSGRKKLNVSSMRSSLTFISPSDGSLIDTFSLDEESRFNSIRHIAIDAKSNVFISLQNQKINSQQTLLAMYRHDEKRLLTCKIPSEIEPNLNRYLGDICLDKSQRLFATTSPRGNQVLIYRTDGEFMAACQVDDVCGVSKTSKPNEFIVTSGQGEIRLLTLNANKISNTSVSLSAKFGKELSWDNHLFLI